MKYLILMLACFQLVNCANKFEVPTETTVHVDAPDTHQTVTVIHTLELSVQLQSLFRQTCTQQVDSAPVPLPEPQRTQAIDACVATASQKFIQDFMTLINQGASQTTTKTN